MSGQIAHGLLGLDVVEDLGAVPLLVWDNSDANVRCDTEECDESNDRHGPGAHRLATAF